MLTRRNLLKRSSLLALAPTVPGFLARLAQAAETTPGGRILVVVQLSGGNDGINTVVPYADEGYAKHRKRLRLPVDRLHKLNDDTALHPSMRAAADLFEAGRLAIVQGVGYPNPNRSHDVSMAIWHSARFDRAEHKTYGWLGRALDSVAPTLRGTVAPTLRGGELRLPEATEDIPRHGVPRLQGPEAMLVGDGGMPLALVGRRAIAGSFSRLDELTVENAAARRSAAAEQSGGELEDFVRRAALDAYATADQVNAAVARRTAAASYPASSLGRHLSTIARLIEADLPTRVYYAVQDGYDTHAAQAPTQGRLLGELSAALKAFLDDLAAAKLAERVLVMTFSEFGRRAAENASGGTDHGTAGPMFLAGGGVRAGLFGGLPNLLDLEQGDLKMSVDFRDVYATVLSDWLGIDPVAALSGPFAKLPLFAPHGA